MANGKPVKQRTSEKYFTRAAVRVHPRNKARPKRGGYRL